MADEAREIRLFSGSRVEALTDRLPALTRLEEAAEKIGLAPERLRDLADAGYAPHWRVDGGAAQFVMSDLKRWIVNNGLLTHHAGRDFPMDLRAATLPEPIENIGDVPAAIRHLPTLGAAPLKQMVPGVYFLCAGIDVVYIGQSIRPFIRIEEHFGNKTFDRAYLLPVPAHRLDEVEAAFIRAMRPRLNGQTRNGVMMAPKTSIDRDRKTLASLGQCETGLPADE